MILPRDIPDAVLEIVGHEFNIKNPTITLRAKSRMAHIAVARQVAMYVLRSMNFTFTQVGEFCGGRHHSTALYAVRIIGERLATRLLPSCDMLRTRVGCVWLRLKALGPYMNDAYFEEVKNAK